MWKPQSLTTLWASTGIALPVKIQMWCAESRCRTVGPIFFENNINSGYYTDTDHKFFRHFKEQEITKHGMKKTA
jgi:hypothetical protein